MALDGGELTEEAAEHHQQQTMSMITTRSVHLRNAYKMMSFVNNAFTRILMSIREVVRSNNKLNSKTHNSIFSNSNSKSRISFEDQ